MVDAPLKAELEALGYSERWFTRLPRDLRGDYRQLRQQEFSRLVKIGSLPLFGLFLGVSGISYLMNRSALHGTDLLVWWWVDSGIGVLIAAGLLMARHHDLRRHFNLWLPPVVGTLVALLVAAALLVGNADFARHEQFLALLILMIGALALRLSLTGGLVAVLLGGAGFAALPWVRDWSFAWHFLLYFGMQALVCMGVLVTQEYRDRVSFVQSVLLEYKNSEVQRLNFELDRLARLDALSGLSNRRHFDEALQKEWARACRDRSPLALIMVDVDHFKAYNDTYGHPAGDVCLTQIAGVLARALKRPADLAARYGGEEFIVLLPGAGTHGAEEVARRIVAGIDALSLEHAASSAAKHVTASIGVAVCSPLPGSQAQTLVNAADAALYEAKRAGRHRTILRSVDVPVAVARDLPGAPGLPV